jgi:hypothetical protein
MLGKMKQMSPTHAQEEDSLVILKSFFLGQKEINIQHIGGNNPSTDGLVHFFNQGGSGPRTFKKYGEHQIARTDYQLKSTNTKGKKKYKFSIEDLRYYSKCPNPVFAFFVDIPNKICYWEMIDLDYIKTVLQIEDIETTNLQSKTVHFKDEKIIRDTSIEDLFNAFTKIPSILATEVPNSETKIEKEDLIEYKNNLSQLIQGDLEKILDLEALIFFYSPFLVSNDPVLQSILSKSCLSSMEFEFYTNKLVSSGIMTKVGDVLSVTDSKAAQGLLSELINRKGIEYIYG